MLDMDDETALLSQVLHDHGERWEIRTDPEVGAWVAVERPTPTALHIVVARDLPGLVEKIDKAG